ncbi:PREDICTED: protein takeout-like [Nicrophorus vespilloides]|uniref:Protein takeout-like n=1 Tax=Nicrophorus vespilloides TaxID=110193 RepID=A0ABM1MHB1_NICVS|nr:PREDICTED: protein takeout-like [Nicrophorus vespilloides]
MKMGPVKSICVFLAIITTCQAMKFPSYITRCSRTDPKLNECAAEHANLALPDILKGDKKNGLPSLMPLEIPEIHLMVTESLKIYLKNVKLFGLENAVIKKMDLDFDNKKCKITAFIDFLNLMADYEVDGHLLILPIVGQGPANITLVGGSFNYDFDYSLAMRRNRDFLKFDKFNLEYTSERMYIRLDNLFNGDKMLGEHMNMFLYENWKDVSEELYPSLRETIGTFITSIASGYLGRIPFNNLFLP